mmetsp:Transcript_30442/g.45079  ORF Transcript_30442/g.45079 Transcript_30442/m.45079 type:complete len:90 (+) Transcript_30442:110-379(+)
MPLPRNFPSTTKRRIKKANLACPTPAPPEPSSSADPPIDSTYLPNPNVYANPKVAPQAYDKAANGEAFKPQIKENIRTEKYSVSDKSAC